MNIYIDAGLQHGRGVFARNKILAGEPILAFFGPLLKRAEVREGKYQETSGQVVY